MINAAAVDRLERGLFWLVTGYVLFAVAAMAMAAARDAQMPRVLVALAGGRTDDDKPGDEEAS